MGVSKVQLSNGEVIVDMSSATITPETVISGYTGYGASGELITGTAKKGSKTNTTVQLPVSGWSGRSQVVAVPGVTANNDVLVGAAAASEEEYFYCGVECTHQAAGALSFSCDLQPAKTLLVEVTIITL